MISTAFGSPLVAVVKDAGNNLIPGVTVNFTVVPASGAGAVLSSGTAVTNSLGLAQVTATANSTAGAYTVTATFGALPSANFSLTNTVGPPASVTVFDGNNQSAVVTVGFTKALTAIVRDAGNNPLSGVTVNFAVVPSISASATLSSPTAVTGADGKASVTATANSAIGGPYTVAATVGALTPANFSLTNLHGPAALVTVSSGDGQITVAGTAFAAQLVALVQDAGNNPVSGATVHFAVTPVNGASATLSLATVVSDSNGLASVGATANVTAGGPYTVTATVGALAPATFSLTNIAGAAAHIAVVGASSQGTQVTTAFPNPLQVKVTDANNNVKSGVVVTFTPVPVNGATATFAGGANTAMTSASGIATSAAISAGLTAGTYQVVADIGPGIFVNFSLTNQPGPPALMSIVAGTGQTAAINTAFATQFEVKVTDIGGNPLRTVAVLFTPPASGGASGTFANNNNQGFSDSNGNAFAPIFTANGFSSGGVPYNVVASIPAAPSVAPVNFSLTNTGGSGGTGTITITNATVGKNLQTPITITLSPAAPSGGLTLLIQSGNASLVLLGSGANVGQQSAGATISEGLATVSTFVQGLADTGTVTITASAPGYTNGTSTITLAPSGFVVAGPNGVGAQVTTFQGTTTPYTVSAARLNSAGAFVEAQQLRGGFSTTVPVASSVTTVASVMSTDTVPVPVSSVDITGPNQSGTVNVVASGANSGSTDIIASAPLGFTTPTSGASVNVVVQPGSLVPFSTTVGLNLKKPCGCR